jgi:regulator of PEP synthase PpsR (kinase-PPPase family)
MFTAMSNRLINLHLVSDSTGETLHSIARATLVRFEESQVVSHRWSLIRTRLQLDRVLQGIAAEPGPVLFTLVDRSLRHALEERCERLGVTALSVLDQVIDLLQAQIGAKPHEKRAAQHVMDADYFRRIDAMHYVLAHDDGQGVAGIAALNQPDGIHPNQAGVRVMVERLSPVTQTLLDRIQP